MRFKKKIVCNFEIYNLLWKMEQLGLERLWWVGPWVPRTRPVVVLSLAGRMGPWTQCGPASRTGMIKQLAYAWPPAGRVRRPSICGRLERFADSFLHCHPLSCLPWSFTWWLSPPLAWPPFVFTPVLFVKFCFPMGVSQALLGHPGGQAWPCSASCVGLTGMSGPAGLSNALP